MPHTTRFPLAFVSLALITSACASPPPPNNVQEARTSSPATVTAAPCGDVVGAWSPVVSGLRARFVTSGSKADRSALDVVLEIENVSDEAVELAWNGYIPLGFASFRLDDAQGKDIEPDWRFGGNAPSGNVRALFRTSKTIRYDVHHGAFANMNGKRALRIGAFWGRELPADSSKRFLRATISAGQPAAADTTASSTSTSSTSAPATAPAYAYEGIELVRDPPKARAFVRTLDVPAVCIE